MAYIKPLEERFPSAAEQEQEQPQAVAQAPVVEQPEFNLGDTIKDAAGLVTRGALLPGAQLAGTALELSGVEDLANNVGNSIGLGNIGTTAKELADGSVVMEAGERTVESIGTLGATAIDAGASAIDMADGVVDRSAEEIPWSENYEYAQFDIGTAETTTAASSFVADAARFAALGVATGGAGVAVGLGAEFALDYFNEPGEGNLSNMLQGSPLANPLSAALAHKDEDNSHWRRFKNALEGLVPGVGMVSVSRVYKGLRAGNQVMAAGGTADDAVSTARGIASSEPDEAFAAVAKAENQTASGRPNDPSMPPKFEPGERVAQIDKAPDVNTSASSFWEDEFPGGGHSLIDEVDVASIRTEEGMRNFVRGQIPGVDVDEISRRLSRQPEEHVLDTFKSLADFAGTGDVSALEPLRFANTFDIKGVDAGGAVVLDTLVKSVGEKITSLSRSMADSVELDLPFKTQARQVLDRAESLVAIKKEATQFASKGLENWKQVPNNLRDAVARDRKQISELFTEMRKGLESSDPAEVLKFKSQMSKLGVGLAATKGDPKLQMDMLEGLARVGMRRFNSIYINSLLSGPLTHLRNISGNLVAIGERSASRAIGGLFTQGVDSRKAGAAFNGIFESFGEAFAVARESWGSPYSITSSGAKVADHAFQDSKALDAIVASASNKGEKLAAGMIQKGFDLTNHGWFNWPGKALQAGDDFSKTLLARMEMRYQAALEADEMVKAYGPKPSPSQADDLLEWTYRQISDRKVAPNGQILDSDLVQVVEDAAFQRPLEGMVAEWGRNFQNLPGGRILMPFYKTAVNITRYGVQNSPLAPLSSEFRQVMKYGTPDQKAIMKGRMALGSVTTAGAGYLAYAGLLTGYGPPPGEERDIWLRTHQPNSIKIGDAWVSYQTIPGMSLVWSTTADMVNLVSNMSDGDADYVLGAMPFFVANAVTSQPMFEGVMALSDLVNPRRWTPGGTIESMADLVNNGVIGNAGARRTLENALSGAMHDYNNWAQTAIARITGGLSTQVGITEAIPRIDILTGKPRPSKYGIKANLINPFTVAGAEIDPIVETVSKIDYPLQLAVPTELSGVKLTAKEQEFLAQAIYSDGDFPKALRNILKSNKFWDSYNAWNDSKNNPNIDTPPKEDSAWWGMLDRTVGGFISDARRELKGGTSDVSKEFRSTFAARSAGLGTGGAGDVSTGDQDRLRTLLEFGN